MKGAYKEQVAARFPQLPKYPNPILPGKPESRQKSFLKTLKSAQ